jgi:DNA polymerase-3 subunit gamma/tau
VHTTAGLAGKEHLFKITDCIINKNTQTVLEIVEQLHNESKDMGRLCEELIDHFRTLMLLKTMNNPDSLLVMSAQDKDRAREQSQNIELENIVYIMDILQSSYDRIFRGSNKRTEIELALIKLTSPQLDTSVEAIIARIAKLERAIKRGIQPQQAVQQQAQFDNNTVPQQPQQYISEPKNQEVYSEKPQVKAVAKQTTMDYEEIVKNAVPMEDWQEVLDIIKKYSITIATSFKNTRAYISGDYILIDSQNELAFNLLKQPTQRERMREAIKEVTGRAYKLGPYKRVEQKTQQEDPMANLLQKAKQVGVEVEED